MLPENAPRDYCSDFKTSELVRIKSLCRRTRRAPGCPSSDTTSAVDRGSFPTRTSRRLRQPPADRRGQAAESKAQTSNEAVDDLLGDIFGDGRPSPSTAAPDSRRSPEDLDAKVMLDPTSKVQGAPESAIRRRLRQWRGQGIETGPDVLAESPAAVDAEESSGPPPQAAVEVESDTASEAVLDTALQNQVGIQDRDGDVVEPVAGEDQHLITGDLVEIPYVDDPKPLDRQHYLYTEWLC